MFGDLAEQEHVFSLLDEWAAIQYDLDLTYDTGSKSNFNKEITHLIEAVQNVEQETIKKNPKLTLGFSYQSELLDKLRCSLMYANTPAKLLENLPAIKISLLQAMIIGIEIKYDKLDLLNKGLIPDAKLGQRRKEQVKKWSASGVDKVKKYTENDKENWLKTAKELRSKNSKLSVRAIATHINKNTEAKPPIETVRKYLANKMG